MVVNLTSAVLFKIICICICNILHMGLGRGYRERENLLMSSLPQNKKTWERKKLCTENLHSYSLD